METGRSAHPWIARFCIRALQLLPTLPAHVAIKWAVDAYPYCVDATPEQAAEIRVRTRLAAKRPDAAKAARRFFMDE